MTVGGGKTVLVTGGSGFIGAHCIVQLLEGGYTVRTTVRSLSREPDVRAQLAVGGVTATLTDSLSFFAADLTSDDGWSDAVSGCDYVLHVASPFPIAEPKDENELIVPARDGALRVLRASRDAGVRRVVLTSSSAAVGYGHPAGRTAPFTESDWTDIDGPGVGAYQKSKTVAERAAWDFIEREGGSLELAVVNPVGVFGPALGRDLSSSVELLRMLMDGRIPMAPKLSTSIVDVRDVASLHLRAMTTPEAAGERYLALAGGTMTFPEIAVLLRERLGESAKRVPKHVLPDWVVRAGAPFNSQLKQVASQLGVPKQSSNAKALALGWTPRSNEESILASARSLVELGLLDHS